MVKCKYGLSRLILAFILLIGLIYILSTVGCATYKLERRLPQDIREWYDLHSIFMESNVPRWVVDLCWADRGKMTERMLFLRLPEKLQRRYMKIFWHIRVEGLKEVFDERLEWVTTYIREASVSGWKTDRGRVIMMCGFPQDNYVYYQDRSVYDLARDPESLSGETYWIWTYYIDGYEYAVCFKYHWGDVWKLDFYSAIQASNTYFLFEKCLKYFAVTDDGWDIFVSELLSQAK